MNKNVITVAIIAITVTFFYTIFHHFALTQRKAQKQIIPAMEFVSAPEKISKNDMDISVSNNQVQNISHNSTDYNNKTESKIYYNPSDNLSPVQINSQNNNIAQIGQTLITRRKSSLNGNLSVCSPYKESMEAEYMGIKMKYAIEIVGWINNKCVLNFESNMPDAERTLEDSYEISSDSVYISGFAPKVRCEFTPNQLRSVEDSFLLEEKSNNRKMLKDPNQIEFPDFEDMSVSDLKLLKILLSDKACKVVNTDDFIQMFENLFQF